LPLPEHTDFGAKVYKISEDDQGRRLTHLKITGGTLHVRDVLNYNNFISEKISQIRVYSGAKFQTVDAIHQGAVCAVTGLSESYVGQGFGCESSSGKPVLEPILRYAVILPEEISIHTALIAFKKLEQEDPQLHVNFSEALQEIHVLLMGEIQLAVLRHILTERFGIPAQFQPGGVVYKETIQNTVEGMGHYEPLRHYAEVRLLLEPGAPGSGLQFSSVCREDDLDRNWQRLILTHLKEKQHLGVLTGSPVTDLKITLTAGRAHKKHTEGGDFRQATYRAVRQGLMQAQSVLLEPFYQFRMEVPCSCVGKILTDLQNKGADCTAPVLHGDFSILEGKAPAVIMMQYQNTLLELTRGRGKLSCIPCGYAPCANPEEVIQKINYHAESDLENSPDSVFCSHGSGDLVKWDQVQHYMHTESILKSQKEIKISEPVKLVRQAYTGSLEQDAELMKIFEQTYGEIRQKKYQDTRNQRTLLHTEPLKKSSGLSEYHSAPKRSEYLLVDGYNIIFAWDSLKKIAAESLDAARAELIRILHNYQGMKQCKLILVFDAYKIKNNPGSVEQSGDFSIVYTKEAETADTYIERVTHELSHDHHARVRVATSDGMEQMIILGNGAYRMSAQELWQSVLNTEQEIENYLNT
ncbi:MAG: NYN domain-containing protein, partial [Oscillospiraceae bacterium]|nr:NYN domain-containing protein [Oscillospiraceae bacterium]